ncbi:MAG: TetR/AcrR family transcriptional regulator, partial [Acidimicrobiales bacterium]
MSTDSKADLPPTRERILMATLDLIGRDGIGAVTNRQVAATAGVALGSLTYHFPNQVDLLRESLAYYSDREVERISGLAEYVRRKGLTAEEVTVQAEAAIAAFAQGPAQLAVMELYLQAWRDPEVRSAAVAAIAAYDDLATAFLDALGVADPERHAPAVVAMFYGLAIRRVAIGDAAVEGTAQAL